MSLWNTQKRAKSFPASFRQVSGKSAVLAFSELRCHAAQDKQAAGKRGVLPENCRKQKTIPGGWKPYKSRIPALLPVLPENFSQSSNTMKNSVQENSLLLPYGTLLEKIGESGTYRPWNISNRPIKPCLN